MSLLRHATFLSFAIATLSYGCSSSPADDDNGGGGFGAFTSGGNSAVGGMGNGGSGNTTQNGGGGAGASGGAAGGMGGGMGGSAGGMGGSGGAPMGAMVINEVAADGQPLDWIELKNVGGASLDISNWYFTDSNPANVYTFPSNTVVAAGAYLVINRWDSSNGGSAPDTEFDFGLGADFDDGEEVHLYDEAMTEIDSTTWAVDIVDPQTWSRVPDGTGPFALASGTKDAENQ